MLRFRFDAALFQSAGAARWHTIDDGGGVLDVLVEGRFAGGSRARRMLMYQFQRAARW